MDPSSLDAILVKYFYSGRRYKDIINRMRHVDGVARSIRWLKYQFRRLGLKRRNCCPPETTLLQVIKYIVKTSDCLYGYRSMWKILRERYHIIAPRRKIMYIMRIVDPSGVAMRQRRRLRRRTYSSRGPNFVWHVDGYDKLATYGIRIHGCIDGYSRKILWMKVASTNSDPRVIGAYFLETVSEAGGCPTMLRSDYGTENVHLATLQIAFRLGDSDEHAGRKSFLYGPSPGNIRSECCWSQLRRFKTQWWIELRQGLQCEGLFDSGNIFHKYALAFTIVPILTREINEFVSHWNTHRIRANRLCICPGGIPEDLYDMPSAFGAEDCLKPVDGSTWLCAMSRTKQPPPFYPQEFKEWAECVLEEIGIAKNNVTPSNCKDIYLKLLQYGDLCNLPM